jgi:CubicO group peptidase (beta-lactamase class C family)
LPEFTQLWVIAEQDDAHRVLTRPSHPITIHNILSHTSGMPFKSDLEEPTLDQLPLQARVRSYAMTPLDFQPDTHYQYSNAGINTAGRIIEVVTGMAYEDFLDERLLHPLGMTDTTWWPNAEQQARLAKAYQPNADNTDLQERTIAQLAYPLDDRSRQPMPAGGLFSTAHDIARFCQMILNGGIFAGKRYLSAAAVRQMTSRQTGATLDTSYGYGWDTPADGRFGHGGAYATQMYMDPATGLITSLLLQHDGFPGKGGKCHALFLDEVKATFGK